MAARHFSWIITLPVTVVVVLFAIANGDAVTLNFWPLPWALSLPVYLIVLICLFAGFVIGAVVAWASGSKRRREARQMKERARALAGEVAELQRRQAAAAPAPQPATRELPPS